jgi:streptogramin lyase
MTFERSAVLILRMVLGWLESAQGGASFRIESGKPHGVVVDDDDNVWLYTDCCFEYGVSLLSCLFL